MAGHGELALTAQQLELVGHYVKSLEAVGARTDVKRVWEARAFGARVGSPQDWAELSIQDQCALPLRIRHFVTWLIVTQRVAASADYVVAGRPFLGDVALRHHPIFANAFLDTARSLGFARSTAMSQWSDIAKAAALCRARPDQLTRAQFDAGRSALVDAARRHRPDSELHLSLSKTFHGAEATMFHLGVFNTPPTKLANASTLMHRQRRTDQWARTAPGLAATLRGYLDQVSLTLRPATVCSAEATLREFACFLADRAPDVARVADLRRCHIEAYKLHLATRPTPRPGRDGTSTLNRRSIAHHIGVLSAVFTRLSEWAGPDVPAGVLIFAGDFPIPDQPLPRFLDDAAAAKLLRATREDPDPFVRLCVEFLARTGLRRGEFVDLTVDAVVQIGSAFWLRVPIGKLHNDRYIPLHPQLKTLIDEWLAARSDALRTDYLFTDHGRRITASRVDRAVAKVARSAGLGRQSPHKLRHTLATQAINRGMSLEAIAALLGHKSLTMTMVYARIADRTVADEYFAVSDKVEALYDQPRQLPADAEGAEMAKLRNEMHQRMLGNGYCARPVEMDCHFESICEACSFFVTTIEFKPTLQRQRDDAERKGQIGRQKIFDGLLGRLDTEAS
ncbi:MAG: tyrosine-type recombinase/integrase [Actinomycetota bacterium]|nr:tyrosine-type recombinase/integrase [Actinomycetota bacterium]